MRQKFLTLFYLLALSLIPLYSQNDKQFDETQYWFNGVGFIYSPACRVVDWPLRNQTMKAEASSFFTVIHDLEKNNNYHISILFDPLGFLLLGPSIHIEPVINKFIGINGGLRFNSLGLVQNLVFGSMKFSYMGHISLRVYINTEENNDGFFCGPAFEYGRLKYYSGNEYDTRVFGGELGYKWELNKGYCFEISDYVGLVQQKQINDLYIHEWSNYMFIFYYLSLKIGKEF